MKTWQNLRDACPDSPVPFTPNIKLTCRSIVLSPLAHSCWGKGIRTLDRAPLRETSPQKRSGIVRDLSLLLAGAMRCCPLPNGSETRRNLERMRQTVAANKLHAYANHRRARNTLLIILVSLLITYCVFSKVWFVSLSVILKHRLRTRCYTQEGTLQLCQSLRIAVSGEFAVSGFEFWVLDCSARVQ